LIDRKVALSSTSSPFLASKVVSKFGAIHYFAIFIMSSVTQVVYGVLTAGHLSLETEAHLCELLQGTVPCFSDVDALITLQQAIASGRVRREASTVNSLPVHSATAAPSLG
jgi:hypothetical protein